MRLDSPWDKILYWLAKGMVMFFGESTREWAVRTVEKLEGDVVFTGTKEEIQERTDTSLEGTAFVSTVGEDGELKVFSGDEKKRGLTALVLALKYRLKQYWVIFLIPVILWLLASSFSLSIELGNYGLYFDVFGAIVVVRGLFRTPTEIDYQGMTPLATSPVGRPEDRLIAAVETVDGMFGASLLAFGFSLQLVARSNLSFTLAILFLVLVVWLGLRTHRIQ